MNEFITKEDYSALEKHIKELDSQIETESKKLAEAASHGGSVPAFMPEYQSIEAKVHSLQAKVTDLKKRFNELEPVEAEQIPTNVITTYKLVTLKRLPAEETFRVYVFDQEATKTNSATDYKIATPKSPLGQQLLGKKKGDRLTVSLPSGQSEYEILDFENFFLK